MPDFAPYDTDLAYIHDTGFGDFARNAAPGVLKIISQCAGTSRLVVDLGCGSGIWARRLVDAGYQVIGIDISAAMIEMARALVPEATFHVQSFVDCAIPECHSVTALGEVVNYLFDSNNSLATLRSVCQRVFEALVSGGAFIFDFAEPERCRGLKERFWEGPDWTCLVEIMHDEPKRQLTRRIVTFRKVGDAYRRSEETHRQQLYERFAVADILKSVGFQVENLPGYGATAFPACVVGVVARKPNPRATDV
jgi:SAM-dependent methyltransferase